MVAQLHTGPVCSKHPELEGLRYTSRNICVSCRKEREKALRARSDEGKPRGHKVTGQICKKHPDLGGLRYQRGRNCIGCSTKFKEVTAMPLNEEKELVAFHEICQDFHGAITDPFEIWKLAKLHAAYMLRPVARVEKRKDHHKWAVYVPTSLTAAAFDFETFDDAKNWAEDKGYRVGEL